jgi:hypothetical protein
MKRRILTLGFFFLAIAGSPIAEFSAVPDLTRCTARSKPLTLLKGRQQRIAGVAPARSTIEYHVKTKAEMNVNVKLTDSPLKLDLYSLGPSTRITGYVDSWSGRFSSGTEYVLVVNNCSGKASSRFRIEITSN